MIFTVENYYVLEKNYNCNYRIIISNYRINYKYYLNWKMTI